MDDPLGTAVTSHFHGDMIGSMRMMTDGSSGDTVAQGTYTAFGEFISGDRERYGYAGAWGYQTDVRPGSTPPTSDMPFMHVGHRYYDPAIGRFLQRDPIGLQGGFNVYAYVFNRPTIYVDPPGTYPFNGHPNQPGHPRPPKPKPPSTPSWPSNVQSEQEARDIANLGAWSIACVGVFGGPPGWIAAGVSIVGSYVYDYYARKRDGLYP